MPLSDYLQTGNCCGVVTGVRGLGIREWKGSMLDDRVPDLVNLLGGAKSKSVVLPLGGGIYPPAFIPVEGTLFLVIGDKILTDLWPNHLEQIPDMADHGKIASNGMASLKHVMNEDNQQDCTESEDAGEKHVVGNKIEHGGVSLNHFVMGTSYL